MPTYLAHACPTQLKMRSPEAGSSMTSSHHRSREIVEVKGQDGREKNDVE